MSQERGLTPAAPSPEQRCPGAGADRRAVHSAAACAPSPVSALRCGRNDDNRSANSSLRAGIADIGAPIVMRVCVCLTKDKLYTNVSESYLLSACFPGRFWRAHAGCAVVL